MSEFLKNAHASLFSIIHPLFSDFLRICYFILSHPLYLSYFLFLLPYFLKVLSFLSPLFITISLLLLALLTLSSSAPYDGLLGRFLRGRADDEVSSSVVEDGYGNSVELEAYKIVFEISSPEVVRVDQGEDDEVIKGIVAEEVVVILGKDQLVGGDNSSKVHDQADSKMGSDGIFSKCSSVIYEDSSDVALPESYSDEIGNQQPEVIKHITEEKRTEEHLKEEKEVNFPKLSSLQSTNEGKKSENLVQKSLDDQSNNGNNLGTYGSMRKEKEWKRTLACKLFEERQNGGSVEDMDLLWETYETADDHERVKESPLSKSRAEKKKQNEKTMTKTKTKSKKGSILDQWLEEEDEEEEETDSSQLCCLQALKLSSGKMNLGLGKPNLVKMSKALKGIGWLHHVTAKNATKNYQKYY